jgi:hypothetical protein
MTKIFVQTQIRQTEDYWDGEQYGDWREEYSYEGLEVFASEQSGQLGFYTKEIKTDFEPQAGQVVFPVIVQYGTGNSFGHSSGNIEVVAVYADPEKASRLRDKIAEYKSGSGYQSSFDFEGETIYTYNWTGYFESLERVFVETELVKA